MLHVFFGTDTTGVRKQAFDFVETLMGENTEVSKFSAQEYQSGLITEFAQGEGLFGTTQIVVFDTPSEDEVVEEEILRNLDLMQESTNHFVLIEAKLDAAKKKKTNKHAENVTEVVADKKERFNVFALTDALLRKDKKSLWLLLSEAWREGVSNEEIIGILFWQIKILRLVAHTNSAAEAGQKPFVYQKAKRALSVFEDGEVDRLSESLVTMYHDGHLGKVDLDFALERWVLSM